MPEAGSLHLSPETWREGSPSGSVLDFIDTLLAHLLIVLQYELHSPTYPSGVRLFL